jgi:hypothetical protein
MKEIPRTDPEVLKALARDARELLDNRAFTQAVLDLRKQWVGEWASDATTKEQAELLRAKVMALEAIPQRLASMARNAEFVPRGQQRA